MTCFDCLDRRTGGCPYAPGAAGNLATEDLVYLLDGMGIEPRRRLARAPGAARFIAGSARATLASKVGQAGGWDPATGRATGRGPAPSCPQRGRHPLAALGYDALVRRPSPGRPQGVMDSAVLLLNPNYEPLNVCNLRRAFRLVFGEKAEVIEYDHHEIRTPREVVPRAERHPPPAPHPAAAAARAS